LKAVGKVFIPIFEWQSLLLRLCPVAFTACFRKRFQARLMRDRDPMRKKRVTQTSRNSSCMEGLIELKEIRDVLSCLLGQLRLLLQQRWPLLR
jgi:hypothetical protein